MNHIKPTLLTALSAILLTGCVGDPQQNDQLLNMVNHNLTMSTNILKTQALILANQKIIYQSIVTNSTPEVAVAPPKNEQPQEPAEDLGNEKK